MTKQQKIAATIMSTIIITGILSTILKKNELKEKLEKCSVYTVGVVTRIHTLRKIPRMKYKYSIKGVIIENDHTIGLFDGNKDEFWNIDTDKLANRRLMLRVYCNDVKANKILWDIAIPDTLKYIPANGWKEIPYGLGEN